MVASPIFENKYPQTACLHKYSLPTTQWPAASTAQKNFVYWCMSNRWCGDHQCRERNTLRHKGSSCDVQQCHNNGGRLFWERWAIRTGLGTRAPWHRCGQTVQLLKAQFVTKLSGLATMCTSVICRPAGLRKWELGAAQQGSCCPQKWYSYRWYIDFSLLSLRGNILHGTRKRRQSWVRKSYNRLWRLSHWRRQPRTGLRENGGTPDWNWWKKRSSLQCVGAKCNASIPYWWFQRVAWWKSLSNFQRQRYR